MQLKISATICDYGTVQSPRKYLSHCWHCSLEIICDKPYGEHFLVTLSPFRNVIISSSSESSTMDWDADELNNPCRISIEWCWWCDPTLSIENVWKLQANDKQCSKQFSKWCWGVPVCKEKVRTCPHAKRGHQTGSSRILQAQTCASTTIIIIILTDTIDHILIKSKNCEAFSHWLAQNMCQDDTGSLTEDRLVSENALTPKWPFCKRIPNP